VSTATLTTKNLEKKFIQADKTLHVLQGITNTFKQGATYAITGASGSGKSTLLHLLDGLDTPTSGSVLFNDQNLSALRASAKEKLLNSSLGFVFQFHYLINELTVLENIILMGLIAGEPKKVCVKKGEELLEHVGLQDKANAHPYTLSGGEQQRVSILRALFNKPAFLLADEPTGNLDAKNAAQIVDFLFTCQKEWNLGVILCTHDHAVYNKMDHVLTLENGKLK